MRALTGLIAGLLLALATPAAAEVVKHSGTIVSVDPSAGMLVLATLEEGRRDGRPTPTSHVRVTLTPSTDVVEARRVPGARPDGEFVAVPVSPSRLAPGVFVTTESEREGGRLVARTVTLVAAEAQ